MSPWRMAQVHRDSSLQSASGPIWASVLAAYTAVGSWPQAAIAFSESRELAACWGGASC